MGIRERILTIRLVQKVRNNPGYAKQLGIEVSDKYGAVLAASGKDRKEQ